VPRKQKRRRKGKKVTHLGKVQQLRNLSPINWGILIAGCGPFLAQSRLIYGQPSATAKFKDAK
jgi:hypothetical protein